MFKTILFVGGSLIALSATSAAQVTYEYTGQKQFFVGPAGIYSIVATGARGGGAGFGSLAGGAGIAISAFVQLGGALEIDVGGVGSNASRALGHNGGGGTFLLYPDGTPVMVAGGGGGAASSSANYFADPAITMGGAAVFGTSGGAGKSLRGIEVAGGVGGSGGAGAGEVEGNGGGGGGLFGAGLEGVGAMSGTGGASAPSFSGGIGYPNIYDGGAGGFGGGGGAGYYGGGGGGGYSGGGGGGFLGGGGGGGSYVTAGAAYVSSAASTLYDGNGSVSIEAMRYFAAATVAGNLNFGVERGYSAAKSLTLTVRNTGIGSAISDTLVTTLSPFASPLLTSTGAPAGLGAGQAGTINFTLAESGPGIVSETVSLGFATHGNGVFDEDVALTGRRSP